MPLNHYAINQVVKGKMASGSRPRFGQFGLIGVVGDALKYRPRPRARVASNLASDRIVYDAFIKTHRGASPETVAMLDESLSSQFHSTARKMGFHASDADMNRRLINIRKNKARYERYGMVIPPATRITPHPSIVPQYAHIIEFSLARLRSRYGVSIDDILIDPDLTQEYEHMARAAAPSLSSLDVRLAALYIRKTRYIAKDVENVVRSLRTSQIESAFSVVGTLRDLDPNLVPADLGLIELLERDQHLYVSRNENLRSAVQQIGSQSTLDFMANDFWRPNPDTLTLRVFAGKEFRKISVSQWQLRLIQEKRPVFNWPVAA
ncbi:MAG TPA: hypothetical protein VK797_25055 [Tepidisphaeraceae bacterium]|jgi:hypothetical protein|nr:hypothetical protein [Tepidisphaeraceae bacterium]